MSGWEFRPSLSRLISRVQKELDRMRESYARAHAQDGGLPPEFAPAEDTRRIEQDLAEQEASCRRRSEHALLAEEFIDSVLYSHFIEKLDSMAEANHSRLESKGEDAISKEQYLAVNAALKEMAIWPHKMVAEGINAEEEIASISARKRELAARRRLMPAPGQRQEVS